VLFPMVLFPVTLNDPWTTPFSVLCVTFRIFMTGGDHIMELVQDRVLVTANRWWKMIRDLSNSGNLYVLEWPSGWFTSAAVSLFSQDLVSAGNNLFLPDVRFKQVKTRKNSSVTVPFLSLYQDFLCTQTVSMTAAICYSVQSSA